MASVESAWPASKIAATTNANLTRFMSRPLRTAASTRRVALPFRAPRRGLCRTPVSAVPLPAGTGRYPQPPRGELDPDLSCRTIYSSLALAGSKL